MPKGVYERRHAPWNKGLTGVQTSWSKGKKLSEESKEKMRQAKLKNPVRYWQGKKRPEIGEKISKALTGRPSPFKGIKRPELGGENQPSWKGENVSYRNLHRWVERQIGQPNTCTHCGKIGYGRQMHWANKSRNYKREITDWIRLCPKCHAAYDRVPSQ